LCFVCLYCVPDFYDGHLIVKERAGNDFHCCWVEIFV